MKDLKYYADCLTSRGYKEKDMCGFMNDVLTDVYFHKNDKMVTFQVKLKEEIESSLKDGDIIPTDFNCYDVITILFDSPICNKRNFSDGSATGITLVNENKKGYIPHYLDLFEKCVDIQENIMKHERFILERHIDNIQWLQDNLHQFLIDHGYYVKYSSIFDVQDRYDSNLVISYHHPKELNFIDFSLYTDCITGDFIFDSKQGRRIKIMEIGNLFEFIKNNEGIFDKYCNMTI